MFELFASAHRRCGNHRLASKGFPTAMATHECHPQRCALHEIGSTDLRRALVGTCSFLTNFIGNGGVIFLRRLNFQKEFVEARSGGCGRSDRQEAKERRQGAAFKPGFLTRSRRKPARHSVFGSSSCDEV